MLSVNAPYTDSPLRGLQNTLAALDSKATVTLHDGVDAVSAAALAAASDVAIVIVGDISLEGVDRSDLKLPLHDGVAQDGLVQAVAAANPRTIVVLKNGGPVLMPWLASVPAVLEVWYPGQEDGNAVANVLFGVVNPSGKLPLTFPAREREAAAATTEQWPGVSRDGILTSTYSEGLQVGYRWYEAQRAEPLFAFGFGLSYTTFSYSKPSLSAATSDGDQPFSVRFWLHNSGSRPGAEVAQVYASFPDAYGEPPKRLVGFQKVFLNPGERKEVVITVDPAASHHPLSFWNPKTRAWELMEGHVTLHLARSSRHVEASLALAVTKRVPPRKMPPSRPRP